MLEVNTSFFSLKAISGRELLWDLGDPSFAPARTTSLIYDLETNISLLLLLPLPLSVYSRSRQLYCASDNGASRCYCNVNSVSAGALKSGIWLLLSSYKVTVGWKDCCIKHYRAISLRQPHGYTIMLFQTPRKYLRPSKAGWVCSASELRGPNGLVRVGCLSCWGLTLPTLLIARCPFLFVRWFKLWDASEDEEILLPSLWRGTMKDAATKRLPWSDRAGDNVPSLAMLRTLWQNPTATTRTAASVTQYGLCTGFENEGREQQMFQPT